MLILLRKVRQRLLANNKITTYIIYAVGEIFLVVIGILIAVNINNWNQRNQIKKQEEALLHDFLAEYESNLNRATEIWTNSIAYDQRTRYLLNRMKKPNENDYFDYLTGRITLLRYFPFQDLNASKTNFAIQTGKISILENDDLREKINAMQLQISILHEAMDQLINDSKFLHADSEIRKNFNIRDGLISSSHGSVGGSRFENTSLELLNDPVFESFVDLMRLSNSQLIHQTAFVHRNLEVIIDDLKVELKRFGADMELTEYSVQPILYPFSDINKPFYDYSGIGFPSVVGWENMGDQLLVRYDYRNQWGAFTITTGVQINDQLFGRDFSHYAKIVLQLRGEKPGQQVSFTVKDVDDPADGSEDRVILNLSDQWQTYEVDLARISTADLTQLNTAAAFVFEGPESQKIYIRQIEYQH